jgi:hypothetical protein
MTIPKMRALNDREYAPAKPVRKREGARNATVVGKASSRRNGAGATPSFADPELSDLRQELLDASVQTSALERELAEARTEVDRLKGELQTDGAAADSRRKLQEELRRLEGEHQELCNR